MVPAASFASHFVVKNGLPSSSPSHMASRVERNFRLEIGRCSASFESSCGSQFYNPIEQAKALRRTRWWHGAKLEIGVATQNLNFNPPHGTLPNSRI